MKILHVNTHINAGGIGQYILSLTRALKNQGIECIVASSGGDFEAELKSHGIVHRYLDIKTKSFLSPKVLRAVSGLSGLIKKEKIDLIHAHTRVSQAAANFTSHRTGIPYVSTCHGYFKTRLSRRLFDTWGARVIAISGAVKTHLEKDFGINEKRIELIYNGVDIDRFSLNYSAKETANAKIALGLRESPVIGTMGRLSPVKGQRYLIEAMRYVISKHKEAQCLVIGSGREENMLKNLAKKAGLEDSIKFAGAAYADIPLYLSCIDIFILPSITEGFGLVLLEAMSAGKPCIGSDTGGINEIIKDGISGLLVPVGDAEAIGGAISRLLDDKILSYEMGRNGKEIVKEKFSINLMANKMIKFYREVISGKQ
jgi:glycosyltransferase involved in cell wall biosynthesis